jgi:hypothetical protein
MRGHQQRFGKVECVNLGVGMQILMTTISPNSIVSAADEQISSDLGGEAIILNLKSGVYYSLDVVGARIWELLQEPRKVSDLIDILIVEYEVDRTQCFQDTIILLMEMAANNLINVDHETN